jgi:hypothetical protein
MGITDKQRWEFLEKNKLNLRYEKLLEKWSVEYSGDHCLIRARKPEKAIDAAIRAMEKSGEK